MCGFVGVFFPSQAKVFTADIGAMTRSIRHRGPDGEGRFTSEDRRFQGGFTRLAIIDIETGNQPIVEEGGGRVLMGNGEIFNYRELRADLTQSGHRFATSGDMEPALKLFATRGLDFVHELNGMYGLVLWERDRKRLILVRDRLGVKPVYWSRHRSGAICFASEVKALFASGLVAPEVDESAITAWLAHGYSPGSSTIWKGVFKLPAAHYLVAGDEGVSVRRYWRAMPAKGFAQDPEGASRDMLSLLQDAVRLQLRSDAPLSALLSGGLDSGLIVAMAAGLLDKPLATYTVRFDNAPVDESPLAEEVAARYGARHTTFDLEAGRAEKLLPRLAWHADDPIADATLLPSYLINEVLSHETRVVLSGTGGDELFAGCSRYFRTRREELYLRLPASLRRSVILPLARRAKPYLAWQLERAEKFDADRGGYLHDHASLFPAPIRAMMGHRDCAFDLAQSAAFAAFVGPPETAALAAEIETYLPDDLLTLLDRTTMAHGVEGRVPLLDHRLVEAALAIPPDVRAPGGRGKGLQRAMAADLLPRSVLEFPKNGFVSPVAQWYGGELASLTQRILTHPDAIRRGWWTIEGVNKLCREPQRYALRLYALLMLELTVRIHADMGMSELPAATLRDFAA